MIIQLPNHICRAIGGHLFHTASGLTDNDVAALILQNFLLWWA